MKKSKLEAEIRFELSQLIELSAIAQALYASVSKERKPWDSAAAAKYVADVAAGLENLCKRRYSYLGTGIPEGPNSHITSAITPEFGRQPITLHHLL